MTRLPKNIDENLTFLLAELDGQLTSLEAYFKAPTAAGAQKVIQRAGYTHNLWSRIQNACMGGLSRPKTSQTTRLLLQNVDTVARNLDMISRVARRGLLCAEQIERTKALRPDAYLKAIRTVRTALKDVHPAIHASDSKQAAKIGQARAKLDEFYDQMFRTYTRDMHSTKHTEDLANALLTVNEIRRMGEGLQGISEAILSVNIGQSVQFEQYFTLRSVLSGKSKVDDDLDLEPLAETRSGSAISSVSARSDDGDRISAVFKDGDLKKVKEERAGVKSWHSVYPGLAPQILSYTKRGQSAALLIEHLPGQTFENLVLNGTPDDMAAAQKALHKTLRDIWDRTRTDEPAVMASMDQLARRMGDVYRVHPEFEASARQIGAHRVAGFDTLIAAAAKREAALEAPFSVYIHGDFNLDNVIYDPAAKSIRFIDLHRSRYMDYVQDVSVFMVSNYRLQIQDGPARARIATVAAGLHKTAAAFARAKKDSTFEYRLALGLARSFASSTRFVFDTEHARRMFLRARYLLETALAVPEGRERRLKLPIKELFGD